MSVIAIVGGLVLIGALAGFFWSFWQPTPKRGEFSDPGYSGPPSLIDDGHGPGHC